jgi:hypothetical protein
MGALDVLVDHFAAYADDYWCGARHLVLGLCSSVGEQPLV